MYDSYGRFMKRTAQDAAQGLSSSKQGSYGKATGYQEHKN